MPFGREDVLQNNRGLPRVTGCGNGEERSAGGGGRLGRSAVNSVAARGQLRDNVVPV